MKEVNQQTLTGERALFQGHDLHITNSIFVDGESPLKHGKNLAIDHTIFKYKYPLWYTDHTQLDHTTWQPDAHAGAWYAKDMTMAHSMIRATKTFRHAQNLHLDDVTFADAGETLWWCDDLHLDNVTATGDYFGMNSTNVVVNNLKVNGNYAFDGSKNVEVHNSTFITHDAFWNCDNVTIYDSTIIGEYLAWNTKNITFVNCWLESEQGLCYVDHLTMRNCSLVNTNLSFEYCSNIDATINTTIDSVKNPINGSISAPAIGDIIFDDPPSIGARPLLPPRRPPMSNNFSEMIDRRHTNSVKWDVADNELPMWVADMDFRTAPGIVAAIQKKAATGIFGYEEVPQAYFDAVQHWLTTEHNWTPQTDWMRFVTGVVPAISSAVRRVSHVGDNVLVQAPVYNIFYNSIVNNGRHVLSSDLHYANGQYSIDWNDLAAKMADPLTSMMILCNPHNPVGKIWTPDELRRIGELAATNHVTVFSDEIHGDITTPGKGYTPFAAASDTCAAVSITAVSPSKTFNVAALHAATLIIPDEHRRNVVDRGINTDELAEPNAFAIDGSIAAYTTGADWVHDLNRQITANRQAVTKFVQQNLPKLHVIAGDATYLVWIDCRDVTTDTQALCQVIRQTTGLFITAGAVYGGNGHDFIRINVACPAERLADGLDRLKRGLQAFRQQNN